MWCVASAPIVPLARDLDAALGMQLSELAVHFRKLSAPLPTTPLPSRAAPAFFPHTAHAAPHHPTPLSGSTQISSTRCSAAFSPPLLYLGLHPRFFPQGAQPLSRKSTPLSGSTRVSSAHRPRRSVSRGLVSAPSRTCATSRPAARHSLRMATAAMGTFFRKHKKRAPFPGERCSFWMLSGRHSAEWC